MCTTCGCSSEQFETMITQIKAGAAISLQPLEAPPKSLMAGHFHAKTEVSKTYRPERTPTAIHLEKQLLHKNNRQAQENRIWFQQNKVLAINLMSSPGSGKTTLLEKTITDLGSQLPISVIEGDQETLNDAQRIRATGSEVVQVNTGVGCHLDAEMISHGLRQLSPPPASIVVIENVGNLVCPALFDLGESKKIVVLSVTEGEDKPLKYPPMFRESDLMILNKTDLLPYLDFDVEKCVGYARQINPEIQVLQLSALKGDGLDKWYDWILSQEP